MKPELWRVGLDRWYIYAEGKRLMDKLKLVKGARKFAEYRNINGAIFALQYVVDVEGLKNYGSLFKDNETVKKELKARNKEIKKIQKMQEGLQRWREEKGV
jgi:hypothetical protein